RGDDVHAKNTTAFAVRLDGLETVSTADDEIFDVGELLVDRAQRGSSLCAKVGQLRLYCCQLYLQPPKTEGMLPLVRTQCIHRGQNSTVISLGRLKSRYPRFQVFHGGHRTLVLAGPTSGQRQSTASPPRNVDDKRS